MAQVATRAQSRFVDAFRFDAELRAVPRSQRPWGVQDAVKPYNDVVEVAPVPGVTVKQFYERVALRRRSKSSDRGSSNVVLAVVQSGSEGSVTVGVGRQCQNRQFRDAGFLGVEKLEGAVR